MTEKERKREIETGSPIDIANTFQELLFLRGLMPWRTTPLHLPSPPPLFGPEREWEYTPLVDLVDEGDNFLVRADIPGFNKENINIEVTDGSIELSGEVKRERKKEKENYKQYERSYSSFKRDLRFPEKVKPEKASASLKNGVLEVTVPKVEPARPKKKHRIKIG
jgi:HSP20 family protein